MSDAPLIKRGSELVLKIESLAYGGMGLARESNFVIFVKQAIPGQKVLVRVYKKLQKTRLDSSYYDDTCCYFTCNRNNPMDFLPFCSF